MHAHACSTIIEVIIEDFSTNCKSELHNHFNWSRKENERIEEENCFWDNADSSCVGHVDFGF